MLVFVLLVLLTFRMIVKVPVVQTWLVQRATSYLSGELETKVSIDAVDIKLFRSVVLKGVYVEDLQQDTLLYLPDLQVSISRFNYKKQRITIAAVTLENARIGIKRYKDPRDYNLDFILDYFSGAEKDTTTKQPWDIKVEKITLKNCFLTYKDYKFSDVNDGIDWDDLALKHLDVQLEDLEPKGDTLQFLLKHIAFTEKSGFVLKHLSSKTSMRPESMDFEALLIQTEGSDIHSNIRFDFNTMDDFQDFITNVKWTAKFDKSTVDFYDLSYFASELRNVNKTLELKGDVVGTVDRFKGKNLELRYTPSTYFKGNVNMTGLPDFFETYIELNAEEIAFNSKDIETIPSFPFDSMKTISLPEQIRSLGDVKFKGHFNGFYNDFVAYGNVSTALGYISSDLNLKIGNVDKQTSYKGNVRLFDFDIGKFWNVEDVLGKISMKSAVEGKGFLLKNIDAKLEGEISALYFNGYDYSNISMNGRFARKLFTGEVVVLDKHLDMDFQGEIDFTGKLPVFNFNSSLRKVDLASLNFLNRENNPTFAAEVSISLTGNTLDNAEGSVLFEEVSYKEGDKLVTADSIFIETMLGERRDFKLTSDFIDLRIAGDYNFSALNRTLQHFISLYIPALTTLNNKRPESQEFNFKGQIKKSREIMSIFFPELVIADSSSFEGKVSTDNSELSILVNSKKLLIGEIAFDDIYIDSHSDAMSFFFRTNFSRISFSDSVALNDVSLNGFTNKDTASFLIGFSGEDSLVSHASFYLNAGFLTTGYTTIKIVPEDLLLAGKTWSIDSENYILADSTGLLLSKVNFRNEVQELSLNGIVGRDSTAKLAVIFKDFQADQVNDFLSIYNVKVGGIVNGTALISGVTGRPAFNSDLNVQNLSWFNDTLGDTEIHTKWDSRLNRVDVTGIATRGGEKNIQVEGYYQITKEDDILDFTAKLQKTYIQSFGHYLKGLVSNLSGIASGELFLKGTAKKPELTGKVYLQKVGFMIDYLKTSYTFSTEVDILEDRFTFRELILNDVKGNQSIVNGYIRHEHLDNFYFDIGIKANKMQVLNTGPADNDMYYGVAYASGVVNIEGYLDYLKMDIGLKTEKNTKFSIPLSNPEEVSQSGFITFINKEKNIEPEVTGPDFSGITLNMDFDVTPEADIFLVFDSKIGDIIEGRGSGTISMTLSPTQALRMFGDFTIEEGKYLFTMQNIINKPFYIEKGSQIRWSGDPYNATVDITAVYRLRAGLYDLFQDSSFRKLVPVDLKLHLTDRLFNPNISFDINVLNVDPSIDNQVKRLINTEEEKYRQAVALLVMRRFTSPSEIANRSSVSSGSVVGANAYEMLSNQLSNWVSQVNSQVNVGVNYRPADALTSEELEVALSTTLFNDRVTIDGNVGVANSTTSNPNNQNTSNLVGDFSVEVKANKDGRIRLKAYNRSNNNSLINNVNSPYTQGVGIFYREEFNTFDELQTKIRDMFRRKSKKKFNPDA